MFKIEKTGYMKGIRRFKASSGTERYHKSTSGRRRGDRWGVKTAASLVALRFFRAIFAI